MAQSPVATSKQSDRIEISVPLRSAYLSTLRTMAATLGADAGFSIDEIDDVRLGIGEVVAALLDVASGDEQERVTATFLRGQEELTVMIPVPDSAEPPEFDELALGILNSVVDRFEVTSEVIILVKRAREAQGVDDSNPR